MEFTKTFIYKNSDLSDALIALNNNGLGTVFIVDDNKKILGILTDGDIRKSLVKGSNPSTPVGKIMNKKFIKINYRASYQEVLKKISDQVKIVPLVDDNDILVDYASKNRISFIPIAKPLIGKEELINVIDCVQSGRISSQGSYVNEFESEFSKMHSNKYSLSVSNGSVALHLAIVSLGIGKGDEVIVPDLTFAASINSIIHAGATPVIADVDINTWNIDTEKVQAQITNKTKAIMPVHLYGNPSNMKEIVRLAIKYKLKIIEDCAESIGSMSNKRLTGLFGDASTFSFFGNKTITTGEGGMILFKEKSDYEKAKILRDHGMSPKIKYWHNYIGFNYRLTNVQAAIGVAQLKRLKEFVKKKRAVSEIYNNYFSQYDYFRTQVIEKNDYSSYWLFSILILENSPISRDEFAAIMKKKGIDTRPVFIPLNQMKIYKNYANKTIINSNFIGKHGISLPTHVDLSNGQINYIMNSIKRIFGH